jgi:osmotically-inducible protein OsmY
MRRSQAWLRTTTTIVGPALLVLGLGACGGGARPYRAMARAATSEESVVAQTEDARLKLRVREALLAAGLEPAVTPYVFMGNVFLVGVVDSAERAQQALAAARAVPGAQSVTGYLPVSSRGARPSTSDVSIDATVKAMIGVDRDERVTRVDVHTIAGHVVLLGIVSSPEARAAVESTARGVGGVTGVTNFLLLPEAGYERLRPGLMP